MNSARKLVRPVLILLLALIASLALTACNGDTEPATNITSTTATVNADGNASPGESMTYWFRYREVGTQSFSKTSNQQTGVVTEETVNHPLSATITGLKPDTTYEYYLCGFITKPYVAGSQQNPICFDDVKGPTNQVSKFTTAPAPTVNYTLSVSTAGDGSGSVTASGINCPGDCSQAYASGTNVTLTADPASGSDFAGWSGGGCSGANTSCALSMTQARSVTATFNKEPVGGGNPPFGLPLLKHLDKVSDWDSVLASAPGSSITNQPDGSIRLYQPGDGERTELQVHKPASGGVPSHGYEAYYTWEFKISPQTNLYNGHVTINQFHGNNKAGYTGGTVITEDRPPEKLRLRVKGGKRTSTSGSQRYEFESDRGEYAVPDSELTFDPFQRGVWNKVEYHVLWTDKWNGFAWMRVNGGPWKGLDNVPTSSNIADVQMFRVGWYPGSDNVPSGGLEMFVRNTAVYGKPVS